VILIAHRGNINGPKPEMENRPEYIQNAISMGYNVEIDVWCEQDQLYLGHDGPQYKINKDFLDNSLLWCHAKSTQALQKLIQLKTEDIDVHYFWHDVDAHTITNKGFIWSYPGSDLTSNSICVMPETVQGFYSKKDLLGCRGICSDFIEEYR